MSRLSMSFGKMPLNSHRKGCRDGGSAQSSPVRSPENLGQENHHTGSVRGSQAPHETSTRSHVSISTSNGHNGGEERTASSRSVSNIPGVALETQSHGHGEKSVTHTYNRSHHQHHSFGWGEKEKVTLLVDGKRFIINPNLLVKHPNTMLGRCVCVL